MVKVTLYAGNEKKLLSAKKGSTLSEILSQNDIFVPLPCAGKKHCGKCKIKAEGELSGIDEYEKKTLGEKLIKNGYRLSCRAKALGDLSLTVDDNTDIKLKVSSNEYSLACPYTVCIDIGTTNIELAVLQSDKELLNVKFANPLCIYGADVISRAESSVKGHKIKMADILINALKKTLNELKIPYNQINEAVITANTTMLSVLTKKDCSGLIAFPFKAPSLFGYYEKCENADNKKIFLPPCISAFVGADAVCGALACGIHRADEKVSMLIDIGTNGEILLNCRGRVSATSTAMGCAFEGTHLYNGMNAQSGAIFRVYIKNNEIRYSTINNTRAVGICAGGVIDLVSVLRELNIIDETGRLDKNSEFCVNLGSECAFKFKDCNVYLTQKDIRSIQQAKSALCAGIKALLLTEYITPDDVNAVTLTGSFGENINIKSAVNIGMFPKEFSDKCRAFRNLALNGAVKLAKSDSLKKESILFSKGVKSINLSEFSEFSELYAECMYIEKI